MAWRTLTALAVLTCAACAPNGEHDVPGVRVPKSAEVALGVTQKTSGGNSVVVSAYLEPVTPVPGSRPSRTSHLAAARIEICATRSSGTFGPDQTHVVSSSGTRFPAASGQAIQPELREQNVARDDCATGWVTFDVANGTTIDHVLVTDGSDDFLRWSVR